MVLPNKALTSASAAWCLPNEPFQSKALIRGGSVCREKEPITDLVKRFAKYLLAAALLTGGPTIAPSGYAAEAPTKPAAKTTARQAAKRDWYPFSGIVASVDKQANTIALRKKEGARVLMLDTRTTLEVEGRPATLANVKPGSYAHGKLHKDKAGKEVITSAKFDKERPQKASESATPFLPKSPSTKLQ